MLTTVTVFIWQFQVSGAIGLKVPDDRYVWLFVLIFPSFLFPLLYFFVFLRTSTRLQQQGVHGIMASPLAYFTTNNPSKALRTLTRDTQVRLTRDIQVLCTLLGKSIVQRSLTK